MIFPPGEAGLFNLNFGTCLFKGSFQLLSFSLRGLLLNSLRSAVYEILSFLKAETESLLNGLDYLKLSCTG